MIDTKKPELNSIFDVIKNHPRYHQTKSKEWFKDRITELSKNMPVDRTGLLKTTKTLQSTRILPGTMIFFGYDPKFKEVLPYYDRFPLSFIVNLDKTGFTGINWHYLPVATRIKLYDKLWQIARNSKMSTQQVLQLNWNLLRNVSKFPEVQPAVKRYLFGHVRTRFIKIPIEDWKTAIMLPNEQFVKLSAASVQRESLKLIISAAKPK